MADTPETTRNLDNDESSTTSLPHLTDIDLESLKTDVEMLHETDNNFKAIKAQISKVVKALAQNSSFFSRVATYWSDLPLWLQIILGIVVVVPTLVLGIVFQFVTLIIFSILSLASFLGFAYLAKDHLEHAHDITDKLRETMSILADSLEEAILAFEPIRKELTEQIDYFHNENDRLLEEEKRLRDKISELTLEGDKLQKSESALRVVNQGLENTNATLISSNSVQTELLDINKREIARLGKESETNTFALSQVTQELEKVQKELGSRLEKSLKITEILQKQAMKVSETAINSNEDRELFQEKLKTFVSNQVDNFNRISDRILKAEAELATLKDELNFSNKRNKELLDRMDKVLKPWVMYLESLNKSPSVKYSEAVSQLGLMAHKENVNPALVSRDHHPTELSM